MPIRLVLAASFICGSALGIAPARALETDQFTLPPRPLVDLGPQVDEYFHKAIDRAIQRTNQKINALRHQLDSAQNEHDRSDLNKQIQSLQQPNIIADALFKDIAHGMPETRLERWLRETDFAEQPVRFDVSCIRSIYAEVLWYKPLLVAAMAPTIQLHGVQQGTDKIGHFIQQGHKYYRLYREALAAGKTDEEARKIAVDWGVESEKTWAGQWWTGAYSNADLAANYAGMKFYLNLTEPVAVGEITRPPILMLDDGLWRWNPLAKDDWVAAFISQHFNEAFNPGWVAQPMRDDIAQCIRQRAAEWIKHHRTDERTERDRLDRLSRWHGEDYGHRGPEGVVNILNAYFEPLADPQTTRK